MINESLSLNEDSTISVQSEFCHSFYTYADVDEQLNERCNG